MMVGRSTRAEIGFFKKYISEDPFNHPRYYFSQFSSLSEKFLLALEFVEYPFLKPIPEYNMPLTEILKIVHQLAKFHSYFEGRQNEFEHQFTSMTNSRVMVTSDLTWKMNVEAWRRTMRELELEVPQEINELISIIHTQKQSKVFSVLATLHQTLCHNDLRSDNIYKLPNGEYGFIDFQMVGNRCNLWDVVYFCLYIADCSTVLGNRNKICVIYYDEWMKNYKRVHGHDAVISVEESEVLPSKLLTLEEVKLQFETVGIGIFIYLVIISIATEAVIAEAGNKHELIVDTARIVFLRTFEYLIKLDCVGNLKAMIANYDSGKPVFQGISCSADDPADL